MKEFIFVCRRIYLEVMVLEISCRLKEIIKERGLKQNFIAEKTGISVSALSALVTGKTLPTLEVAYRIAAELDLNVMEIWVLNNEVE